MMNELEGNGAVFIVSCMRSGSTLLRLMLSSHPKITILGDHYSALIHALLNGVNIHVVINPIVRKTLLDHVNLIRSLDPAHIKIQALLAKERDREFIGVQMHDCYHELGRIFPGAKFIHLVRDPRPVSKSMVKFRFYGNCYFAAKRWLQSVIEIDRLREMIPKNNFFEIKYEAFVSDVVSSLRSICSFIGVEYAHEMLDYIERSTYSRPTTDRIDSWKQDMTEKEIYLVESVVGESMPRFGYDRFFPMAKLGRLELLILKFDNKFRKIGAFINFIGFKDYVLIKINFYLHREIFKCARDRVLKKVREGTIQ